MFTLHVGNVLKRGVSETRMPTLLQKSAFRATGRLLSEGTRIFTENLQLKRLQSQVHTADSHHFLPALCGPLHEHPVVRR